jgi:uncharacterized membrane protein
MINKALVDSRSIPHWVKYLVIFLLVAGVGFRVYSLDHKVYWVDEAYTSLRMTGHTKTEVKQEVFTGEVVDIDTLQRYQLPSPEKGWDDTFAALRGNAEHTPLYFLMARAWTELFGYSIASIRALSVLFSLLTLPALAWLCWELFESAIVAGVAVGLVAISPIFVLYAQEARPYSLWTLMTVLSSAVLLWAMRTQKRSSWVWYGVAVATGLYSQLLFGVVAIAHGVYVALLERVLKQRSLSQTVRAYLLATGGAIMAFLPWLVVFFTNLEQVRGSTLSLTHRIRFEGLVLEWMVTFGRLWIDRDLRTVNFLLAALAIAALYFLCRRTPRHIWLFVLTLVVVPFLALAIPDLVLGGQRSSRIRYLFPSYIGIQIAVAYFLVSLAVWSTGCKRWLGRGILALLLIGGLLGNVASAQAEIWWNKSENRSGYYPVAASLINQAERPLVISNGPIVDVIAFSYRLKPDVKFQLWADLDNFQLAPGYRSIFLLNPTRELRKRMEKEGYRIKPVKATKNKSRRILYNLWQCQPKPAKAPDRKNREN